MLMLITIAIVGMILLFNEWWWRGRTHGEVSRKIVHISVGSFVAFWPLYLSWTQIEILSVAFVLGILLSKKLSLFKAIHSVQRPTWGEIFFGVSVGLVAWLTHSPAIYAVALLHMSLADGLAAIVGVRYGASNAYQIFGMRKSVVGSLTFAIVSAIILMTFSIQQQIAFQPAFIVLILGATIIENLAVRGLDNLLIPLLVAYVLTQIV